MIPVAGYADRWSVGQGETIEFKVSSQFSRPYSARMVKIICADPNPDGPRIIEENLSSVFAAEFPSRIQNVQLGSYATVPVHKSFPHLVRYTLMANIWPTLPQAGPQSVMSLLDLQGNPLIELRIGVSGKLTAIVADDQSLRHQFELEQLALSQRKWYTVWLGVDLSDHRVSLAQLPMEPEHDVNDKGHAAFECESMPSLTDVQLLLIAASGENGLTGFYNGKIERPSILNIMPDLEIEAKQLLSDE